MNFYLLLLLFIILLATLVKNKSVLLFMTGILFIFIIGFRDMSVGNDTKAYYELFIEISRTKLGEILKLTKRFDIGYIYFNKSLSYISKEPLIIFVFSGVVYIYIFFKNIKFYSKNFLLSILLIILMGYLGKMMNTMREMYAISFTMMASQYLIEEKNKKFILFILIATSFHKIAIVFIAIYFLYKQKINKKNLLILIFFNIFIYIFFDSILNFIVNLLKFYTTYSGSKYRDGNIRSFSYFNFMMNFFISVCMYRRIVKLNLSNIKLNKNILKDERKDIFLFWTSFVSTLILFLSFKFNLLDRVANYFGVYNIFIIPNLLEMSRSKFKIILKGICIIFFVIYFVVINVLRPNWNTIIPYKFIKIISN